MRPRFLIQNAVVRMPIESSSTFSMSSTIFQAQRRPHARLAAHLALVVTLVHVVRPFKLSLVVQRALLSPMARSWSQGRPGSLPSSGRTWSQCGGECEKERPSVALASQDTVVCACTGPGARHAGGFHQLLNHGAVRLTRTGLSCR